MLPQPSRFVYCSFPDEYPPRPRRTEVVPSSVPRIFRAVPGPDRAHRPIVCAPFHPYWCVRLASGPRNPSELRAGGRPGRWYWCVSGSERPVPRMNPGRWMVS